MSETKQQFYYTTIILVLIYHFIVDISFLIEKNEWCAKRAATVWVQEVVIHLSTKMSPQNLHHHKTFQPKCPQKVLARKKTFDQNFRGKSS